MNPEPITDLSSTLRTPTVGRAHRLSEALLVAALVNLALEGSVEDGGRSPASRDVQDLPRTNSGIAQDVATLLSRLTDLHTNLLANRLPTNAEAPSPRASDDDARAPPPANPPSRQPEPQRPQRPQPPQEPSSPTPNRPRTYMMSSPCSDVLTDASTPPSPEATDATRAFPAAPATSYHGDANASRSGDAAGEGLPPTMNDISVNGGRDRTAAAATAATTTTEAPTVPPPERITSIWVLQRQSNGTRMYRAVSVPIDGSGYTDGEALLAAMGLHPAATRSDAAVQANLSSDGEAPQPLVTHNLHAVRLVNVASLQSLLQRLMGRNAERMPPPLTPDVLAALDVRELTESLVDRMETYNAKHLTDSDMGESEFGTEGGLTGDTQASFSMSQLGPLTLSGSDSIVANAQDRRASGANTVTAPMVPSMMDALTSSHVPQLLHHHHPLQQQQQPEAPTTCTICQRTFRVILCEPPERAATPHPPPPSAASPTHRSGRPHLQHSRAAATNLAATAGVLVPQLVRLPCHHVFCYSCLQEWLQRTATCPNCRAALGPTAIDVERQYCHLPREGHGQTDRNGITAPAGVVVTSANCLCAPEWWPPTSTAMRPRMKLYVTTPIGIPPPPPPPPSVTTATMARAIGAPNTTTSTATTNKNDKAAATVQRVLSPSDSIRVDLARTTTAPPPPAAAAAAEANEGEGERSPAGSYGSIMSMLGDLPSPNEHDKTDAEAVETAAGPAIPTAPPVLEERSRSRDDTPLRPCPASPPSSGSLRRSALIDKATGQSIVVRPRQRLQGHSVPTFIIPEPPVASASAPVDTIEVVPPSVRHTTPAASRFSPFRPVPRPPPLSTASLEDLDSNLSNVTNYSDTRGDFDGFAVTTTTAPANPSPASPSYGSFPAPLAPPSPRPVRELSNISEVSASSVHTLCPQNRPLVRDFAAAVQTYNQLSQSLRDEGPNTVAAAKGIAEKGSSPHETVSAGTKPPAHPGVESQPETAPDAPGARGSQGSTESAGLLQANLSSLSYSDLYLPSRAHALLHQGTSKPDGHESNPVLAQTDDVAPPSRSVSPAAHQREAMVNDPDMHLELFRDHEEDHVHHEGGQRVSDSFPEESFYGFGEDWG